MRYFLEMMAVGEGQKAVARGMKLDYYHQLFFEECLVTKSTIHEALQTDFRRISSLVRVAQQKDLAF